MYVREEGRSGRGVSEERRGPLERAFINNPSSIILLISNIGLSHISFFPA